MPALAFGLEITLATMQQIANKRQTTARYDLHSLRLITRIERLLDKRVSQDTAHSHELQHMAVTRDMTWISMAISITSRQSN